VVFQDGLLAVLTSKVISDICYHYHYGGVNAKVTLYWKRKISIKTVYTSVAMRFCTQRQIDFRQRARLSQLECRLRSRHMGAAHNICA
jgi:hypothetical protein